MKINVCTEEKRRRWKTRSETRLIRKEVSCHADFVKNDSKKRLARRKFGVNL